MTPMDEKNKLMASLESSDAAPDIRPDDDNNDTGSLPEPIKSMMEEFHDIQPEEHHGGSSHPLLSMDTHHENETEELNLPTAEVSKRDNSKSVSLAVNSHLDQEENENDDTENEQEVGRHGDPGKVTECDDILCPDCSIEVQNSIPVCCMKACHELATSHVFCGQHAKTLKNLLDREGGVEEASLHKSELSEAQQAQMALPLRKRKLPPSGNRYARPNNRPRGEEDSKNLGLNLPSIGLTAALYNKAGFPDDSDEPGKKEQLLSEG